MGNMGSYGCRAERSHSTGVSTAPALSPSPLPTPFPPHLLPWGATAAQTPRWHPAPPAARSHPIGQKPHSTSSEQSSASWPQQHTSSSVHVMVNKHQCASFALSPRCGAAQESIALTAGLGEAVSWSEHCVLTVSGGAFLIGLGPAFSHQPLWDEEQRIQRAEDPVQSMACEGIQRGTLIYGGSPSSWSPSLGMLSSCRWTRVSVWLGCRMVASAQHCCPF